ncbi:hypothetical protein BACCAP_00034 [Pseudoflavonifractor capillosus ATCC 29799]|uniref:Uncharacterized protein n=1 Tax=Pseudoflavonifractor capillosus ATCC 29799 TaxID=411467 RepID=A6NPA6_9FIRM|nr:hypothetical protein BACCAP_00034 [Pseudoflavonifractor capillosus ATCC 29799]
MLRRGPRGQPRPLFLYPLRRVPCHGYPSEFKSVE